AYKTGVCPGKQLDCSEDYRVVMEFPFSSDVKRMTKIFQAPDESESGKYIVFTKGASEILITSCTKLLADNGKSMEFYDELRLVMMNTVNSYAVRGYRILSFAYRYVDTLPPETEEGRDQIESDLIYIGFVAIMDPPREGVKEAILKCHEAGVGVVMITGDSLPTAKAIAKQIGIITSPNDRVMEGNTISHLSLDEDISDVKVFARVSPSHKEKIVDHYQQHQRVVAMTGDGVNDALALNMADAGIAMGISGTDVAKESADMIISDDSFNSIVEGIYRGRGIFANIRSLVFFFISINLFEGVVQFIISVILKMPYYMDDEFYFQWVFLSLTLHMFPGFILTFDRISKDVMKEKPRDSEEILSKSVVTLMGIYGILLALSMVITYVIGINGWYPVWDSQNIITSETMILWDGINLVNAKTLTMLMATLYFCECALALQIRRPNKSLWKLREDVTPFIFIIIGLLFATFLAIMYVPGLQIFLAELGFNPRFMTLTLLDWIVCFAISMVCIGGFELVKWIARKLNIFF
ncbi:MAG: HAD-IC family P-type ATPase, partial [Promethearchaeota archaeon]